MAVLKLLSNSTLGTNCLIVYIDGGQNLSQTTFLVAPQQLKSKLGDNVHLPCPTTGTGDKWKFTYKSCHLGDHHFSEEWSLIVQLLSPTQLGNQFVFFFYEGGAVITWSWNGRLISAGGMKVYTDDRISVVDDGRELLIRSVTTEDRGEWMCTVQLKLEPVSLSHRLEILVAPSVTLLHDKVILLSSYVMIWNWLSQETMNVEEGSSVKFECSAEGFPSPTGLIISHLGLSLTIQI